MIERSGTSTRISKQLLQRLVRRVGGNCDQQKLPADQTHRRQICQWVVGQLFEYRHIGRKCRVTGKEQRVSIGRRRKNRLHGRNTIPPWPVLNDYRLLELLGQRLAI